MENMVGESNMFKENIINLRVFVIVSGEWTVGKSKNQIPNSWACPCRLGSGFYFYLLNKSSSLLNH